MKLSSFNPAPLFGALAVLAPTLICGCAAHDQRKYQEGYVQGEGDSIKREYWLRQEREQRHYTYDSDGRRAYYTLPGPKESPDGVRLAPHNVTVPIEE